MDLRRFWVSGFKGMRACIDWAPVVVLFGRNGSGKSTILEAAHSLFTQQSKWRSDPVEVEPADTDLMPGDCAFVADESLAEQILQFKRGSYTILPWPEGVPLDLELGPNSPREEELEPDFVDSQGGFISLVRDQYFVRWILSRCAKSDGVRADVERVANRRLASRWFLYSPGEMHWLAAPRSEFEDVEIEAAKRLYGQRGLWPDDRIPLIHEVVEALATGSPVSIEGSREPMLPYGEWYMREQDPDKPLSIVDTVRIASTDASWGSFLGRAEDQISQAVMDRWIEEKDDGWSRVSGRVAELCAEVSRLASSIAPRFLSEGWEIILAPVSPKYWRANEGRRLTVRLADVRTGSSHDIRTVGHGLGLWAAYTLEEALRRVLAGGVGQLPRLYVLDEPEAHLHPDAQRDVARWIAEELSRESTILLASHALPFLNIPREDVAYYHVVRSGDAAFTERVDDDVLGRLTEKATEAGVAPAEILQLTRAFLILEGKHDEIALQAFFGNELKAARIQTLPLRGTHNHLALVELEYLIRHRTPLIAMFDNVQRSFLEGGDPRPEREEEAAIEAVRAHSDAIEFVAFDLPDIICAIPEDAVRLTLERFWGTSESFPGWEALVTEWRKMQPRPNLKRFFVEVCISSESESYRRAAHRFLRRALHMCREEDVGSPAAELVRAVQEILARSTDQAQEGP